MTLQLIISKTTARLRTTRDSVLLPFPCINHPLQQGCQTHLACGPHPALPDWYPAHKQLGLFCSFSGAAAATTTLQLPFLLPRPGLPSLLARAGGGPRTGEKQKSECHDAFKTGTRRTPSPSFWVLLSSHWLRGEEAKSMRGPPRRENNV